MLVLVLLWHYFPENWPFLLLFYISLVFYHFYDGVNVNVGKKQWQKNLDVEGTAGAAINQDTYQVVLPFFFFFRAKLSLATGAMKEILGKIVWFRCGFSTIYGNFAEWLSKGICVIYGDVIHGTWGAGEDSVNSLFPYTQLLWSLLPKTMTRRARKTRLKEVLPSL